MLDSSNSEVTKSKETRKREYQILRGEAQNVEPRWSTPWLLSEYIRCSDGVIGKMDGTIPLKNIDVYAKGENGLREEKRDLPPPDSVIWLDKSARPVSWLVRELWPILARTPGTPYDPDGEIPKKPTDHFLNINKEDWLRRMGVPPHELENANDRDVDLNKIPPEELGEHLARIRAIYSTAKIEEGNLDEAWQHPTIFDGKHVMILDEVVSSGKTLMIAKMLLSAATPEATFSGQYWSQPGWTYLNKGNPDQKDSKVQTKPKWVPVWYDRDLTSGRGVGDRNFAWPEIADERNYPVSRQSRVGRHVLSTRPHNPDKPKDMQNEEKKYRLIEDTKANELRDDFKQLAGELRDKKVLYNPSSERSIDDSADRIEVINGISVGEWTKRKAALEPKTLR